MITLIMLCLSYWIAWLLLAFFNANRIAWSILLISFVLAIQVLFPVNSFWLLLFWLFIIFAILLLCNLKFRKYFFSRYLFKKFQVQAPKISSTEQVALDAGNLGWEVELFRGQPNWQKLKQFRPYLTDEEKCFLNGPAETLCEMVDDWEITNDLHDLPQNVWDFIKREKFLCMIIPTKHGGLGFSAQAHSAVIIKLASRSITVAVTVMVPNSLGPGQLLLEYGTPKQKQYFLPRLVSGEDIPCFALTAPDAGSDATALVDKGIVCRQHYQGKDDVLGINLNWSKRYITLGPVATLLGLAFKLYDPDHLLGYKESIGITLALIPTKTKGVEIGRRHMPGAIPFQNGPNFGKDVFIPIDWIIGGPDFAGKGWMMLVECLSEGRGISLPALSVASAKLCTHVTSAYARVREQFHQPISKFEGIEEVLGRMVGKTYLMEGARALTVSMIDSGRKPSVATAIVKYHLTEMMREVINDAMDVHGGKGIMLGPKNYLMRMYQAVPISITVEGANILTRNLIIFGQGSLRCHPCLMDEIHAVNDDNCVVGLDNFDRTLGKHISHILRSSARAFLFGLSGGYLSHREKGKRVMTRLSAALAFSVELILLLVGGKLKKRERISARLGDVLSYLYLGSGVIAQFNNNRRSELERPLYDWAITYCGFKAQEALWSLAENLPFAARVLMKWICFPLGRSYHLPLDKQDHAIAQLVLERTEMRKQLLAGIYYPEHEDQTLMQLRQAFILALKSEEAKTKIRQARHVGRLKDDKLEAAFYGGVINKAELEVISEAFEFRRKVIEVDDFSPEAY